MTNFSKLFLNIIGISISCLPVWVVTLFSPLIKPFAQRYRQRFLPCSNDNNFIKKDNICIIGGGFGGLYSALDISKRLGDTANVYLIDPKVIILFY